jgi:hypothetical protein
LLLGKTGYIGRYTGYTDNGEQYRFVYYTNHTDLGDISITSILKRLYATVIGGSNQPVIFKWGYDFTENYYAAEATIPQQAVSEYGVAEYGANGSPVAQYSGGITIQELNVNPSGAGKVVQTGYEADINGAELSIQKLQVLAKRGRIS